MRVFEERASTQLELQGNDHAMMQSKTEEIIQNVGQLKEILNTKADSGTVGRSEK